MPIEDLWRGGGEVAERMAEAPSLAYLTRATAARLRDAQPVDPLVRRAAVELNDPRARVADIAADAGVSQRHLLRRFKAGVGYGPKPLARVLRLQRFVAALLSSG